MKGEIILESNQVLFPKYTLRLDGLTADEKMLVVDGVKLEAKLKGYRVVETRGSRVGGVT
jgi:hypothetical protein